uniref:Candidate effector 12 n=1 Tax=Venturia inaequalis TaxID=5025 RepID=C0KM06_VENIN|nr:candidate effector 12 [Venturia inaequalis]
MLLHVISIYFFLPVSSTFPKIERIIFFIVMDEDMSSIVSPTSRSTCLDARSTFRSSCRFLR